MCHYYLKACIFKYLNKILEIVITGQLKLNILILFEQNTYKNKRVPFCYN